MSQPAALVYFILGTPGAGRRALVADLVENGLSGDERALVLVAASETADPADEKLAALGRGEVRRWTAAAGSPLPTVDLAGAANVFLLADPRADAVTQIEALKPWLAAHGAELARIFTVVNCQFAEKHAVTAAWFDACIHFSDVVFLTKRDGVENKWLSTFIRRYEDQAYPCYFIHVKKGGLPNPALVLEPQPRRVAQYFDPFDEIPADLEIETDDDEPEDPDDETPPPEPYFERNRSGRRVKEIPDIRPLF
jgi:hypothetical protein